MSDPNVPDVPGTFEGHTPPEDVPPNLQELPQPRPDIKSLTEVAREAANGEWGIGQERRKRLVAAGWNYKEVEAEVIRLRNS